MTTEHAKQMRQSALAEVRTEALREAPEVTALVEALRAFDPQAIGHGQSTDLIALHAAQQKARAAIAKWEAADA